MRKKEVDASLEELDEAILEAVSGGPLEIKELTIKAVVPSESTDERSDIASLTTFKG